MSRGWKIAAGIAAVVLVATTASGLVDNEVSRRLATVPLPTTTSLQATTTTVVSRPATPRHRSHEALSASVVEATTTSTSMAPPPAVNQSAYDIITKLDALPVREERTFGYTRYRFGLWQDPDGDSCTNRDDVIANQAVRVVRRTNPCDIVSGEWLSPYDKLPVYDPDEIRVDHVVGLFEAWRSGAWDWTDAERNTYLNHIETKGAILAVTKASDDDKDGRDPSDWLPTNGDFRCTYLQTWVDIKTLWNLSVDAGERESIAAAALSC